jgi:hypothetical protein
VIGPELAAFLESPCSLIVGTVDADGLPDAGRAWGVEVLDERTLRVLLSTQAPVTRRNVEGGGAIALTATHFMTFESVQLKGRATQVDDATAADRIRFERYVAGATRAIAESDGTPEELVARFITGDVYACWMVVDSVYDQTPGSSAGTQLAPAPS